MITVQTRLRYCLLARGEKGGREREGGKKEKQQESHYDCWDTFDLRRKVRKVF